MFTPISTRSQNNIRQTILSPNSEATIGCGVKVEIESDIKGLGLMAAQTFKKMSYITQYEGTLISKQEIDKTNSSHIFSKGALVISGLREPKEGMGGASFANHSATPNAAFVIRDGCVFLRALVDIHDGEWIHAKYPKGYIKRKNLFAPEN